MSATEGKGTPYIIRLHFVRLNFSSACVRVQSTLEPDMVEERKKRTLLVPRRKLFENEWDDDHTRLLLWAYFQKRVQSWMNEIAAAADGGGWRTGELHPSLTDAKLELSRRIFSQIRYYPGRLIWCTPICFCSCSEMRTV